jgi:pilus assembly protein TadC
MPLRALYSAIRVPMTLCLIFLSFAYCGFAWAIDGIAKGYFQ